MSDSSSIGVDYDQLRLRISRILALPPEFARWSEDQKREVDMLVKETCQMVAYPPVVDEFKDHQWSWLKPIGELETEDGIQWYLLPEDFDHFDDNAALSFTTDEQHHNFIPIVSESFIRKKDYQVDYESYPEFAAVRIAGNSDGTTEQRWEIGFFPVPNSTYRLKFQYTAVPFVCNERKPYPLGSKHHSLLYILAAEAVAERFENDTWGERYQAFQMQLQSDILRDARRDAHFLGYNGNDPMFPSRNRSAYRRARQIFYNDVNYGG